ncbi:hypothetical protein [Noviherbaspirillum galbum]|uniref:RES domain-containing protein n=1 Tax=Noviherbaspirillum galbum TaxID=2709383 RepID=A0A6B3SYT0_9BURK|nr:hypothetical protein [Noviherbaspirillum galbum]NEX63299.1 hypothetical protein [Noviherbaspirillum galbum]
MKPSSRNTSPSSSSLDACDRPPTLYRYSKREWLERALALGEFRLRPASQDLSASGQILPFGQRASKGAGNYLTLSLANAWDEQLFDAFPGADCCLVVHDTEEFGERMHRAVQRLLPSWAGIDAAISYGKPSPLGSAFSKDVLQAREREWLFAWRPTQPGLAALPLMVRIGSLEGIAELRGRAS